MDDYNKPTPRRVQGARQRQANRYRRQQVVDTIKEESTARTTSLREVIRPATNSKAWQRGRLLVQDGIWFIVHRTPTLKIAAAVIALTVVITLLSLVFSPTIGPNVWALEASLTGLTVPQAALLIEARWRDQVTLQVMLNGEVFTEVAPNDLGLHIDAQQMAQNAYGARYSGIPFGAGVEPIIMLDDGEAQRYLLSIVDQIFIPAYEAGYSWQADRLVGVPGKASREMDVAMTLERIKQNPALVFQQRRLDLLTLSTAPTVTDPTPYLAQAEAFIQSDFKLVGYDPFANEFLPWGTSKEEMTKWLAAGTNALTVRAKAVEPFVRALNERLKDEERPRYLDEREVVQAIEDALTSGQNEATLRIRYLPLRYEIAAQDQGYAISRKTGMPFLLIDNANPGLNWNQLSIGQKINLPSPDTLLPEPPVPHKRIIVDLERHWLMAFENGEIKFSYPISIGRDEAPTYPGVYQVLSHNEKAYGSSFTLCTEGTNDCSQWEMHWFMGIYEVVPGLMNGLHGDVLLPNGALLGGGGGARSATTFGCVMADNGNAKALYEWAETGTMVEVLSVEYAPRSDLGRFAYDYIRQNAF